MHDSAQKTGDREQTSATARAEARGPTGDALRVLVLAPHAFYIDRGTPIDVDRLVRAMCARGERVDLLVYPDGVDRGCDGLTIHRVRAPGFIQRWITGIGPGFSVRKLTADWFMLWRAVRLVRTNRYDVIHAGEEAVFIAMLLRLVFGVPYVFDMDSSIAQQMVEKMAWLRPIGPVLNWCERRAIRGAMACAPVCPLLGELCAQSGARHYEIIHDISELDPALAVPTGVVRDRLDAAHQGDPIFMYVGNLEVYQGIDLLLEAFGEARRAGVAANLVIAGGSDANRGRYKERAARLGIADRTVFLGPWAVDDLARLLGEADVLVCPRIRGINTPMKVFPYLHAGKAVLVTDLPTHTQSLDGSVVKLGEPTPEGFGRAIEELAGDAALRERLGKAGRVFAQGKHTWEAHQRRVDRLYDFVRACVREEGDSPQRHGGTEAGFVRTGSDDSGGGGA